MFFFDTHTRIVVGLICTREGVISLPPAEIRAEHMFLTDLPCLFLWLYIRDFVDDLELAKSWSDHIVLLAAEAYAVVEGRENVLILALCLSPALLQFVAHESLLDTHTWTGTHEHLLVIRALKKIWITGLEFTHEARLTNIPVALLWLFVILVLFIHFLKFSNWCENPLHFRI